MDEAAPKWAVNDIYLFEAIEFVLGTGVQMSSTKDGSHTSMLTRPVLKQILTKLNEFKMGTPITSKQLTSRLSVLRSDHNIFSRVQELSGWDSKLALVRNQTDADLAKLEGAAAQLAQEQKELATQVSKLDVVVQVANNTIAIKTQSLQQAELEIVRLH